MTSANASVNVKLANEIAWFASLLDHPLRVRLMFALATTGPSSATGLSVQLGDVTLYDCHYHLTKLRKGGAIKLVRSRPVRGATERVYRLAPRPRTMRAAMHLRDFMDVVLPTPISAESIPEVAASVSRAGGP